MGVIIQRAVAAHNLGVAARESGNIAEAERHFRAALSFDPGLAQTSVSLGGLLLSLGRYAEGWPLYEARRSLEACHTYPDPKSVPEWRGEDLRGKRIAVLAEQGFGDQIMFARFLPELERRGGSFTYVCPPAIAPLFPGAVTTLSPSASGMDYWAHLCSLPLRLGVTLENLPRAPYLAAPARSVERPAHAGRVGLFWRSGSTLGATNSLPPELAESLRAAGLVSLQPEDTGARDFADTAALVSELDRVVTIDSAVAHLAGAMGKPVWVLLPAQFTDWRWTREGPSTPWYPTARLFRQPSPGDWASVVAEVKAALG